MPPRPPTRLFARIWPYLRPYRGKIVLGIEKVLHMLRHGSATAGSMLGSSELLLGCLNQTDRKGKADSEQRKKAKSL